MRIAIFDYLVTATNPAGSCHLKMLESLCYEHQFTVFSVRFENPCPDRIEWVRIPAPRRPLALLFVVYHLLAPLWYWAYRLRRGVRFDLVQAIESNAVLGDISYVHFCHAAYLREHWGDGGMRGLRGVLRYIDHKLHALMEPVVYKRAKAIIVPSRGLARELAHEYPWLTEKIAVVANPVDLQWWQRPSGFDAAAVRRAHGLGEDSFVLAFVALGQFERKGLPILLDALSTLQDRQVELLVVGGENSAVAPYKRRCQALGIGDRVSFTGTHRDIRAFLWAADAFVLPSSYEVFPLVSMQAAAASLPLLVSDLHGVEEFLRDKANGILVKRSPEDIQRGITAVRSLPRAERESMGRAAREDVQRFAVPQFILAWREFYRSLSGHAYRAAKQEA